MSGGRTASLNSAMAGLFRTALSILYLVPAIGLAWLAVPHLRDGVALDAAVPVPNYMIANRAMPVSAYKDAERALSQADAADGDAAIARAEAALRSGSRSRAVIPELSNGLMAAPASARGWTLLSLAYASFDKRKAAGALGVALELAPKDFWLAEMRAEAAAQLWSGLDADARVNALAQTRLLWEEPLLRGQLRQLLTSADGVALVKCAFSDRQDEMREMNRWLSAERRRHPYPVSDGDTR